MNRRGFFAMTGAMIAGMAVAKVAPDVSPLGASDSRQGNLIVDSIRYGNGTLSFRPAHDLYVSAGDGISIPIEPILRLDGMSPQPGDLHIDADGVIQLRADDAQVDFDYFSPWL